MANTPEAERIDIYLPLLPDSDGMGKIDQTVTVTINGENTIIQRGEHVRVPFPVFEALYNTGKYPNL